MTKNSIDIMLVSHTNAGKTTLIRTLLGKDVGEVVDAPDVTMTVEPYELAAGQGGATLRLFDTPGFGDSFRLARRLKIKYRWVAWVVCELWDRHRNPRLWRGQRVAFDLKSRADVILYLVNSVERPVDAVYMSPELEVLACLGKPVMAILNQSKDPQISDQESALVREWHEALASYPVVKKALALDSYTRCWVQELVLYDEIGHMLDGPPRETYRNLALTIKAGHKDRFESSIASLSTYLLKIASDKVEIDTGWFGQLTDAWDAIRKKMPWSEPNELKPQELAMRSLAQRFMNETKAVTDDLIALNRLKGVSNGEIVEIAGEKFTSDGPIDGSTSALAGGVISGALAGLGADIMSGGMTLGTGMLVGAVLGALGSAALAKGYNMYTEKGKKIVGWSAASLTDAYAKSMLLYLAIAHFGRGQGEWRRGEDSGYWRKAVDGSVALYRPQLLKLWAKVQSEGQSDSAQHECAFLVRSVLVELLEKKYPETSGHINPAKIS